METPNTVSSEAATSTGNDQAKPKKAPSLTKILPTERLALDRQVAALRAYAAVFESNEGKPVSNQAAGEIAKMAAGTIIMTNAWFVDVGFLGRTDAGFTVAPEVVAFLNAEHGISPENAPEKLRPILERNWAAQLLIPRLRVGPLEAETARKIIGEACSATPDHIPRIDLLVEFFCFCGVVKREGSQIRLVSTNGKIVEPPPPATNPSNRENQPEDNTDGLETYMLTLD